MKKRTNLFIYILVILLVGNQSVAQTSDGTMKAPQTILLANRPAAVVIQIPTKAGGYYIKDYGEGITRKINLIPPVTVPLPIVRKNVNGEALSEQILAGKAFFTNYTTDDGLSSDAISCSMIDRAGNLWLGFHTWGDGVTRYDGKSFTSITTINGLVNNHVNCISEDSHGNLWFGTFGGISKYDGKKFTSFTTSQGLLSNFVYSIVEDKSGNLWIGTLDGISCYKDGKFTNYAEEHGLKGSWFSSIVEDNSGNIWFATKGNGLYCYNGKTFRNITETQGLAGNTIHKILKVKNGNLWIGTSKGVSYYDGESFTNYTTAQGLAGNSISSITEDRKGNIWLGSVGVSCFDGNSFTNFSVEQGLAHNNVSSITQDKSGNLWFCTSSGLSCYKGSSFLNFPFQDGFIKMEIYSIVEDKNKNIWFGTNGDGIWRYDGMSFTNFKMEQGLAGNGIRSIVEDKSGNIWFARSSGGGVSKYNGKSFTNYTTDQGLLDDYIQCAVMDTNGNIWFSTSESGVSCYNGKSFTNYTTEQGLICDTITCSILDNKGNIWFGTAAGLSRFDGKSFSNFTKKHGLPDDWIISLTADKFGNIWLGTSAGLICLPQQNTLLPIKNVGDNAFITYTTAEGLPDNVVTQIAEGENNIIYVGTKYGICELIFAPQGKRKVGKSFNTATGYPLKSVTSGQNTLYKDSKGILWISTSEVKTGLVRFDPLALNVSTIPPNLVLKNIKINQEMVSWYSLGVNKNDSTTISQQEINTYGKILSTSERDSIINKMSGIRFEGISKFNPIPQNLTLPHDQNSITFSFMGIDLDRNFLVRYQYILEGHSKDWSPVIDKTEATFENINEGTYSFKLKAQGPDGIWSSPLTYTFKVLPPWYRHWLAYLSYTLLLISVVWSLYRYGLRKALKRQELKHDISLKMAELEMKSLRSQMNPHFIFNSLQSIQNFLISNKSEDANEYLLKFSKLMRLVLENSMQQEVTLRDDILALDLYMQLEQLRFTRPFSYEIIVEDSINPEIDSIPPLLLQPFVENSIWHGLQYKSDSGKIMIRFKKEKEALICVVEDNGVGRSFSKKLKEPVFNKESLGMKLTEERISLLHKVHGVEAKLSVFDLFSPENKPSGTRVEVYLPMAG